MKSNEEVILENQGKIIEEVYIVPESDYIDTLTFVFSDRSKMTIKDDLGICCERREMSCDDVLTDYIGARFLDVIVKDAEIIEEDSFSVHQVMFLEIVTSRGSFTLTFHNRNNGYYCGFDAVFESILSEDD